MFKFRQALMGGVATCAVVAAAAPAHAEMQAFDIPAQAARTAIPEFGRQSGIQILAAQSAVGDQQLAAVKGDYEPREALRRMLEGTNLRVASDDGRTVTLAADTRPQSGSAAGDGAEVEALIVTAQKREEDIQDVPIAISAFTQEDLTRSQVAGGPDLMTQVPNMTFTKTNFSGYSIQIRGIGTQAISATTDAAVAVAFNNSSMIRNRFFEQEFYDLQRVEVLRGPQGTLYGRNATAGVVNIISAKPTFDWEAKASADVANYNSTRLEGMINLPLVEDKVALRFAGAWTKREGYSTNELTGNPIDGRDLWSTRLSLRFEPTDTFSANLIWEHFQEDDDRLRSGKQLCDTHTPTELAGYSLVDLVLPSGANGGVDSQVLFSQGCQAGSLYSPDSFGTPNGKSLPYYLPLTAVFLPTALDDPYASRTQSHDLRAIESTIDPEYRAKSDVVELQLSLDLGGNLTLASETAYNADSIFSLEDFNRFNTVSGAWNQATWELYDVTFGDYVARAGVLQDGVFCDPQLGCSDRLVAVDLSTAESRQFSQEFRLSSDYDGAFNFSLGANFLRYDTEDKYYVFINSLSLISAVSPYGRNRSLTPYVVGESDNRECLRNGLEPGLPNKIYGVPFCTYMDPNPIGSLNDQGHNYFLSKNPYKLISYAVFGEAYYNLSNNLKVTAGLRWTIDKKEAPRVPSWLMAGDSVGYPVEEVVRQEWSEPTGRLAVDWKPVVSFTDETLVYASYARGYKAGGANPPGYTLALYSDIEGPEDGTYQSATHPNTFAAEYVNAFEVGNKNTLADGRVTLNLSAFYYDYTGYQISQIVDRSAYNQNFDAEIWGAEVEADWRPVENLRLGFKGGFENTRLADGSKAIDLMDRSNGGLPDENGVSWVVVKPFPTYASNCILPTFLFVSPVAGLVTPGGQSGGLPGPCELAYVFGIDPITFPDVASNILPYFPDWQGWDPATAPNHGEGIDKDLSGNELPNAPHFTATVTADYTLPLPNDWLATLHSDIYYQSEAWTRIFNTEGYDKLKAYTNVNLAAIFTNEDAGWKVMAYVKNLFDRDSITGAFLNSDDTGLTTNVFLTEPRLYGLRVTKEFSGGPWWTGASSDQRPGEPYPLTIELGGQVQNWDAPYQTIAPAFVDSFSAALDPLAAQRRDLDRGDGREIKLTWRPAGSPWTVSLGARHGGSNSDITRLHQEEVAGDKFCAFPVGSIARPQCDPNNPLKYNPANFRAATNWSDASAASSEEHTIVDFEVGKDMGVGLFGEGWSALKAGLRYATFESASSVTMGGIPDWELVDGWSKYPSTMHQYNTALTASREFSGTGPIITWDAAKRLLGDDMAGHLDIDWSVAGGLLFGKQETQVTGSEGGEAFDWLYNDLPRPQLTMNPVHIQRNTSTTAPLIELSLGLSYQVQRVKIGAGYRWERYFDILDAGYDAHQDADRTIDGPYFKLAIGFGG